MAILIGGPARQIAYFVPDVVEAARKHSAMFGSGPFYVVPEIPLTTCLYYGEPSHFVHSSAYGQWGEVMVEFVQQDSAERSCFTDLFPDGAQGLHHVALIVDDLKRSMRGFEEAGHRAALYAEVAPGQGFAMMDCVAELGHFIELYEPTEALLGVYDLVRTSAQEWDGSDLIRALSFS
ncbi:MAG: VOC family protein [Blastomonas sp.]